MAINIPPDDEREPELEAPGSAFAGCLFTLVIGIGLVAFYIVIKFATLIASHEEPTFPATPEYHSNE